MDKDNSEDNCADNFADQELLSFEIILPMPPSLNQLFPANKAGRRFKSKRYKDWLIDAAHAYRQQFRGKHAYLQGRLRAIYTFCFNNMMQRDIANYEKPVSDFLSGKFFDDDCQIDEMISTRQIMKGKTNQVLIYMQEIPDRRFDRILHGGMPQ